MQIHSHILTYSYIYACIHMLTFYLGFELARGAAVVQRFLWNVWQIVGRIQCLAGEAFMYVPCVSVCMSVPVIYMLLRYIPVRILACGTRASRTHTWHLSMHLGNVTNFGRTQALEHTNTQMHGHNTSIYFSKHACRSLPCVLPN